MSSYKATKIYGLEEFQAFFAALDRHLTARSRAVVIGGAAAAFHKAETTTNDIDTFEHDSDVLEEAAANAARETGLDIPLRRSTVADVPWNCEDRLVRIMPELKLLELYVLEKHDLCLSKIVRGYENDLQHVEEIHANNPLDREILIDRFCTEMSHAIIDERRHRINFLEMIEKLFGELAGVDAKQRLERGRST